jgi:hypothetical protein
VASTRITPIAQQFNLTAVQSGIADAAKRIQEQANQTELEAKKLNMQMKAVELLQHIDQKLGQQGTRGIIR